MKPMKSGSNLEKVIASGNPAVTAELGPPMSASPDEVVEKAKMLKGCCDAANITDCQTAVVRLSSIAAASIIAKEKRDRLMEGYHRQYPCYNFAKHKGYPTAEHRRLLDKYGPCEIHRRTFKGVRERFDDQ